MYTQYVMLFAGTDFRFIFWGGAKKFLGGANEIVCDKGTNNYEKF